MDSVELSPSTLSALREFLAEKAAAEEAAKRESEDTSSRLLTTEDWQLSQFWYSVDTSNFLAREVVWCLTQSSADCGVAVFISSPSAYKAYRASAGEGSAHEAFLLEFDKRFSIFGKSFVHYDYNDALNLPNPLLGRADVILLDPPFLNEEVLCQFSKTVNALAKPNAKILMASGAIQLAAAKKYLALRPTKKAVEHEAGRLSNPFCLFSNYEHEDTLGGWDTDAEAAIFH